MPITIYASSRVTVQMLTPAGWLSSFATLRIKRKQRRINRELARLCVLARVRGGTRRTDRYKREPWCARNRLV